MVPLEMFATGLAVISAGALGLALVLGAARGAAMARRCRALRQLIEARNDEIDVVDRRIAGAEHQVQGLQGDCGELETRRLRAESAARAAAAEKVELVHEVGVPQPGHTLFRCELNGADVARAEPRRILFARAIWERRNVALVWAATAEGAAANVRRVFPEGSRVRVGAVMPVADGVPAR